MCTHFCERRLQGDEFQYESSLLFSLIGLAILALHFEPASRSYEGHFPAAQPSCDYSTSVNSWGRVLCARKESNEDEEDVGLLVDVLLFQRPILRS